MKKLLFFLMVFAAPIAVKAQNSKSGTSGFVEGYKILISPSNAPFRLSLIINNKSDMLVESHNPLPNQPLDNYVFLHGGSKFKIIGTIDKADDLKNYRYNVIQDDSIYLVYNGVLGKTGFKN
jgi:hypothetical protein